MVPTSATASSMAATFARFSTANRPLHLNPLGCESSGLELQRMLQHALNDQRFRFRVAFGQDGQAAFAQPQLLRCTHDTDLVLLERVHKVFTCPPHPWIARIHERHRRNRVKHPIHLFKLVLQRRSHLVIRLLLLCVPLAPLLRQVVLPVLVVPLKLCRQAHLAEKLTQSATHNSLAVATRRHQGQGHRLHALGAHPRLVAHVKGQLLATGRRECVIFLDCAKEAT
mmetsp:Transcript_10000/g.31497  ORF Transcript_10000/g.31497 Transcript_10000/m.31497 type:complete len:226 (+) Transcript_10000:706-1383(+)